MGNTTRNMFVDSIGSEMTETTNGMPAFMGSLNANVDLFYKIGAMRGQNVTPLFAKAFVENKEMALRIAQWVRDVRGGAGERKIFRDILQWLETRDENAAVALASKTPEVGRWDDLLVFRFSHDLRNFAFLMIADALGQENGLCAKWMPRKGPDAVALRDFLGLTPKQYRKTLVALTDVVESKMCSQKWNEIDFGKLPSLASARYKSAFYRNAETAYKAYIERLKAGTDKINAAAVYPYDVLKGGIHYLQTTPEIVKAQWEALPNYMGNQNVLAMVDVSGSMTAPATTNGSVSCLDVAVSLGLYVADKSHGAFKDTFLTFSGKPELLKLRGDVLQKMDQMIMSSWGMNTNIESAFDLILSRAVRFNVPAEDMPTFILIMSDMQFDACAKDPSETAMQMIKNRYESAGYKVPTIVFWNLNAHDNVPVRFDEKGTALVSGFSPAIMKAILKADLATFTPEKVMLEAVMIPRYDLPL